jgi:HD-like signal output (HDOD) protein
MSVYSLQELFIKAVSSDQLQLPTFPAVAMKLQKALHDGTIRVADLEAMIVGDQALSSQILRVANSSLYKGLQQITTIQKAVIRLGIRQVAALSIAMSQRKLYLVRNPQISQYMEKLWQHAFASGLGAQWLSQRCGYQALVDTAFMAGLLHNIGQLAILRLADELCGSRSLSASQLSEAVLLEVLGSPMHNAQGYVLMKRWNLPEEYGIVARDHHKEPYDGNNPLLIIVRLVDQLCDKLGVGLRHDPSIALGAAQEAMQLSITELQLAELEILLEDWGSSQTKPYSNPI